MTQKSLKTTRTLLVTPVLMVTTVILILATKATTVMKMLQSSKQKVLRSQKRLLNLDTLLDLMTLRMLQVRRTCVQMFALELFSFLSVDTSNATQISSKPVKLPTVVATKVYHFYNRRDLPNLSALTTAERNLYKHLKNRIEDPQVANNPAALVSLDKWFVSEVKKLPMHSTAFPAFLDS